MKIRVKKVKKKHKDSKFVAKAVILHDGKVLLLKRSDYLKKHKGEWDLPGGHLHIGEDLKDGLVREVNEETGLTIKNPKQVFNSGKDSFFVVKMKVGEVKLSNEHTSHEFFDIEDLNDLKSLTTYYREAINKCVKDLNKKNE